MFQRLRTLPSTLWLVLLLLFSFTLAASLQAQEDNEDDADAATEEADDDDDEESDASTEPMEEMTVTGSRLNRDSYSSISPLQIIDSEVEREAGLIDAAEILQKSTQAQGQQIDLTYTGYVLDDGPGSSTISLRGLGASRSLVLVNGRRMAPAGVEGAPSNPDLNLIPGALVQQYELLLDGASSVYGSDAVGGVVNVILAKDFDGLEIDSYFDYDEYSGLTSQSVSLKWGQNYDRGFYGLGMTFSDQPEFTRGDARSYQGCTGAAEVTQDGEVRNTSQWFSYWYGMEWDEGCGYSGLHGGWITSVPFGPLFHTPGSSNGGWRDFSVSRLRIFGQWFYSDMDGDGFNDVSWQDYASDRNEQFATLYPEFTRRNVMAYGEYTFPGEMNLTTFFEFAYGSRSSTQNGGGYQLFPFVNPLNPFNPCNPFGQGGVDCGTAINGFLAQPSVRQQFIEAFGCDPGPGGSCDLSQRPIGPSRVRPVVVIEGDRNITTVDVAQTRFVGGARFDMPFLSNYGSRSGWQAEFFVSYSDSTGETFREGVIEDRLEFALGNLSAYGIPCDAGPGATISEEDKAGCVPVNLFAPSVMNIQTHQGHFATQQERDYLFDSREFDTDISQLLVSYYMTGNLYSMQGGTVAAGFGFEWRQDEIDSIPNDVAAQGKFFGFSADQGAVGEKSVYEWFGEIEFPILGNLPFANELTVNLSARNTEEEYSGNAWTYSAKMAYRPVSSFLIRGTKGTSFRAPNLRELFLLAQTGFLNLFDPCVIPTAATDPITGEYLPDEDRREEHVLRNCRNNGVDPTALFGFPSSSVEVASGGALDLLPETSTSETWGFSFEQPFTNAFSLAFGGSVYNVSIDDTIVEPSAGFIIRDCYYSETGDSPFCQRITRGPDGRFSYIHQGFINRDNESVRGIDFNLTFADTFTIFDRPIAFGFDFITHKLLERSSITITEMEERNEDVSEWYFPRYRHRMNLRAQFSQMRISWGIRVLGRQEQNDEFEDVWGSVPSRTSDTCLGPEYDDVLCRDIDSADFYWVHSLSFAMARRDFYFTAGISNVMDEQPPQVNGSDVFSRSNVPIGAGYDILGRSMFMSLTYRLGGGL
ncbi:MAG: TonB-dependent receptor [Gammaproteobacteria bacterium]|nr:TonB-dependent receptor [Gammaproteobacteria bacterium]